MADFVAVIRRAVDGLAKNTPEMREKVYDKARGAVRRQLENMKPAPPEAMIHRQMDKLESAIVSVEAEHAEALPADEPVTAAPFFAPETETAPEPEDIADVGPAHHIPEPETSAAAQWPQDEVERTPEEDVYSAPPDAPQVVHPDEEAPVEPAPEQLYPAPAVHADPVYQEPVHQEHSVPVGMPEERWPPREEAESHASDAVDHPVERQTDHWSMEETRTGEVAPEPIGLWPAPEHHAAADERSGDTGASVEPDPYASSQFEPVETDHRASSWPDEAAPAAAPAEDAWLWPEAHPAPSAPRQTEAAWQDVPDLTTAEPLAENAPAAAMASEPFEAHFSDETHASASSVRMPSTEDIPLFTPPLAAADAGGHDEFEDALRTQRQTASAPKKASDPWNDLEELIGYNPNAMPAAGAGGPPTEMEPNADADMVPPPRPYRVAPKKRNYAGPILALIGVIIIAAGGYALWLNRESLTEVVGLNGTPVATDGAIEGVVEPAPETAEAPVTEAPAAAEPEAGAPAVEDVAALPKFTQRLLTDGTEVDEGPGPGNGTGEGQSVAQLNAPPATPAEVAASAPAVEATPSAAPADAAALAGEKMFLYEERVGQTAPTAIEGAVSWSLQREAGANGVQEPVVQGRVNIPGRGLTALITFKRNTDTSLPASHLVEVVFAVPPGFEGGAIDSVQRIAMKQTEQDRGDALIAVPAKITDDFHMIALNDFPDARATNLELLRSRNWMDIPLAYRNGRRALMTLQKGDAGMRAFNDAIREWQAMSSNGSGGSTGSTGQ
jgi:hypothetical protein